MSLPKCDDMTAVFIDGIDQSITNKTCVAKSSSDLGKRIRL